MRKTDQSNGDRHGALGFFILALVGKIGLKSLYELRQQAFLEPGGISSAMKSLENEKLISRTAPGKRRRRDLTLTPAGTGLLNRAWQSCLREYADSDAVLRAAMVAWVMESAAAAASYLNHMGQARLEGVQRMKDGEESLKRSKREPLPSYAWMRSSLEAHRRGAEGAAFLSMSGFIMEHFKNNAINAK